MKPFRIPQLVYLLLLLYIIAALLFWGFSLQRQSRIIYEAELRALPLQTDSIRQPQVYAQKRALLETTRISRKKQYFGEGSTFLIIILIGAVVVYSSFRRSLRLSRQQTNFMLAVTHELKSPIAAIKLNLQTIERRKLSEEQQALMISRCITEANRLNDLCNNLLIASQLEGHQYQKAQEEVSFTDLVSDAVQDYHRRYPGRIMAQLAEDCAVTGDPLLLLMAVSNLLENAIKYSPAGSPVSVVLQCSTTEAVLEVTDEGVGVPEDEKSRIFEKFYRVGNENTRSAKGTGLGLYLTERILRQHKGRISVRNNLPRGSIFEIRLPAV
ncbi:MAG: two-component sensor histidine kinase [Sphingobacteriales bacterium]|nr:MAG: two-component sensor histidine kinase [Sphingobacteriales bacterium]